MNLWKRTAQAWLGIVVLATTWSCSSADSYNPKTEFSDLYGMMARTFDMDLVLVHSMVLSKYLELFPKSIVSFLDNLSPDKFTTLTDLFEPSAANPPTSGQTIPVVLRSSRDFRALFVSEYLLGQFSQMTLDIGSDDSWVSEIVSVVKNGQAGSIQHVIQSLKSKIEQWTKDFLGELPTDIQTVVGNVQDMLMRIVAKKNVNGDIFRTRNMGFLVNRVLIRMNELACKEDLADLLSLLGSFVAFSINLLSPFLVQKIVPSVKMFLLKIVQLLTKPVDIPIISGFLMNSMRELLGGRSYGQRLNANGEMSFLLGISLLSTMYIMYFSSNGGNGGQRRFFKRPEYRTQMRQQVLLTEDELGRVLNAFESGDIFVVYRELDWSIRKKLSYHVESLVSFCSIVKAGLSGIGHHSNPLWTLSGLATFPFHVIQWIVEFPILEILEGEDDVSRDEFQKMKDEARNVYVMGWMFGLMDIVCSLLRIQNGMGGNQSDGSVLDLPPVSVFGYLGNVFGKVPRTILCIWATIRMFLVNMEETLANREYTYSSLQIPHAGHFDPRLVGNYDMRQRPKALWDVSRTETEIRAIKAELRCMIQTNMAELTGGINVVPSDRGLNFLGTFSRYHPVFPDGEPRRETISLDRFIPPKMTMWVEDKIVVAMAQLLEDLGVDQFESEKLMANQIWSNLMDNIERGQLASSGMLNSDFPLEARWNEPDSQDPNNRRNGRRRRRGMQNPNQPSKSGLGRKGLLPPQKPNQQQLPPPPLKPTRWNPSTNISSLNPPPISGGSNNGNKTQTQKGPLKSPISTQNQNQTLSIPIGNRNNTIGNGQGLNGKDADDDPMLSLLPVLSIEGLI